MFTSLKEFVYLYNHIKPRLSLNFEELETPARGFKRKYKYEETKKDSVV